MKIAQLSIALVTPLLLASCTTMYVQAPTKPQPPVVVQAPPSVPAPPNEFYDDLAPYGRWFNLGAYGLVWQPSAIPYSWRPYTDGYWVYTGYGWTYYSDAPYGWAVYHYGRWGFDDRLGWVWVPDTEWAPAWVAWRDGGDYIGWAPLPPDVKWHGGRFHGGGRHIDAGIQPHGWNFVKHHHFCERHISRYVEVPSRNVTIINNTTNITNYTVINNRVVNSSLRVDDVERYTNSRVVRYNVSEVDNKRNAGFAGDRGNELRVYRPRMANRTPESEVSSPQGSTGREYPSRGQGASPRTDGGRPAATTTPSGNRVTTGSDDRTNAGRGTPRSTASSPTTAPQNPTIQQPVGGSTSNTTDRRGSQPQRGGAGYGSQPAQPNSYEPAQQNGSSSDRRADRATQQQPQQPVSNQPQQPSVRPDRGGRVEDPSSVTTRPQRADATTTEQQPQGRPSGGRAAESSTAPGRQQRSESRATEQSKSNEVREQPQQPKREGGEANSRRATENNSRR